MSAPAVVTAPVAGSPVRLEAVSKEYRRGDSVVRALDRVSVEFPAGGFTAVMGPSGSGKSTLLHCAAGLDTPTSGEVVLAGVALSGRTEEELTALRREHVAFVFQSYNLLPALTVRQNVALPMLLAGRKPEPGWLEHVLATVGLADRVDHRPAELSGGQQQRVAVARALAARPAVTFADEPTGALDTRTAADVLDLLRRLADAGQTIVVVTHDPAVAAAADTVLFLVDGRVVQWMPGPTAEAVAGVLAGLGAPRPARTGAVPQ
jgi:putative ABC transport system ATP-binding protein